LPLLSSSRTTTAGTSATACRSRRHLGDVVRKDDIITKHPTIRALVDNEWLFLHRIDSTDSGVHLRGPNGWEEIARITAQRL
jgi:hypothetical protein